MVHLLVVHPGNPNLFELYGLLFGTLISVWLISSIYDWLLKKPWRKNHTLGTPDSVEVSRPFDH